MGKAKKFKKPKDQNAPKRPLNAYFLFSNAVRSKIQKSLGTEDFGTVAKEIKKQWDSLSATEKNKYQSKAQKSKDKYAKVLAKYHASRSTKSTKRSFQSSKQQRRP